MGEESARAPNADIRGYDPGGSGWVTTQQAARALGISARTVRWHIEHGNLEAESEGEGVQRTWRVSIDSLQAFRDARQRSGDLPGSIRANEPDADVTAAIPGNPIRELADRLAEEAAKAAEYRVRLELTEQAQSTLEEQLAEERRRREEAERERDDLRRRLEAPPETPQAPEAGATAPESTEHRPDTVGPQTGAREPEGTARRPWWVRIFGG